MRLSLITDLHGNREALEAVLEDTERRACDRIAFLGDFVGYGADPAWVVEQVERLVTQTGALAVRGNHDEGVAHAPSPTMVPMARQIIEWTRAHLNPHHLAFLQALPMSLTEDDRLFVHANTFAPARWEYIHGRDEAKRCFHTASQSYIFCGHVHEPRLYHMAGGRCADFVPHVAVPVPVPSHRRWLALPGSAGQPRDGNPAASYAIFDTEEQTLTFHRVPYDHETAAEKIRAAGLPEVLAQRLIHGQ